MNHDYQKVIETMHEIGIDESYIGKTLRLYGLEEFPKSGLDDRGLGKLVKTAVEISNSEASLTTRKPKKGYLPAPKIKKEEQKVSSSLESQIFKEDLQKIKERTKYLAPKIIRGILKTITYPIINLFLFPTMFRKARKQDGGLDIFDQAWSVLGLVLGNGGMYVTLLNTNPKLIPYIFGTQTATNLISGIYEWRNSIKERAEKEDIRDYMKRL